LRRSISAVEVVGDADAERNIVKARALGEVVADMIDLLRKTNRSRLRSRNYRRWPPKKSRQSDASIKASNATAHVHPAKAVNLHRDIRRFE
jgi:hypothetical protein